MHVRFTCIALAAAGLLAATPAFADEPLQALPPPPAASPTTTSSGGTIDAVHLRNGGLYRGRVTEIVPGDHVTILVEKGEPKRVAWGDIDKVIVASPPPPAAAPTGDWTSPGARVIPPATPPTPAPMVGPKVRVHINSPSRVILYRRPAGTNSWVQACASPCDEELPLGDQYRVAGNGVAQSKEVSLGGNPGGAVTLTVDPPSIGGMIMGGLIAGAGVTAGYIGMVFVLVSLDHNSSRYEKMRTTGLVAMGLGTVATVGGLVMFLVSARTDLLTSSAGGTKDAFRRDPIWRPTDTTTATLPAAQYPLLFTHAF